MPNFAPDPSTAWANPAESDVDPLPFVWVVGTAASGLDLATETTHKLYQDESGTANFYPLDSEALPQSQLRPQNRRALALAQAWLSEPDDLGPEWWAEFERDLKQNRLIFREVE